MFNITYDNCSVEFTGNVANRIHWFCTHEAMHRENPPGNQSMHMHPDDVKKVLHHVIYVPEYSARAINNRLNHEKMAREEWCDLEFVPSELWHSRKQALGGIISRLEEERSNIKIVRKILVGPKDLFINVCQHSDDRKDDKSCSVSLRINPEEAPLYNG